MIGLNIALKIANEGADVVIIEWSSIGNQGFNIFKGLREETRNSTWGTK